jgi:hypothetical protein
MQTDGNLVVYEDPNGAHTPIWASNTWLSGATMAKMTLDGVLVLSDAYGTPIWYSSWPERPAAFLALREDGNLVVYEPAKYVAWRATQPGTGAENMGDNLPGFDDVRVVLWNGETLAPGSMTFSGGPAGTASLSLDWYSGNAQVTRWYDDYSTEAGWSTSVPMAMSNTSLRLTNDGELQLVDGAGDVWWSSSTAGYRNTFLGLSGDGVLSIYRVISLNAQSIGFLY